MKRFAMIGVGGYIAPRHLKAIKDTNNELIVAMDIHDSVGIMDSYFPDAEFFTDFSQFEAFINDEKLAGRPLDYVSICSPNFMHLPHIQFALRNGLNVICEKPLVLQSENLATIERYEEKFDAKVNAILQLRLHSIIKKLRDKVEASPPNKIFDVDLTYMTCRGKWYERSWKGEPKKSGGVAANIGIHFFDMLHFIFGDLDYSELHFRDEKTCAGYLKFKRANVKWFLSIDSTHLPKNAVQGEKLTYRSIKVEGEEIEFSGGFNDLHTLSYEEILSGNGYRVAENLSAIQIVESIQKTEVLKSSKFKHPSVQKIDPEQ